MSEEKIFQLQPGDAQISVDSTLVQHGRRGTLDIDLAYQWSVEVELKTDATDITKLRGVWTIGLLVSAIGPGSAAAKRSEIELFDRAEPTDAGQVVFEFAPNEISPGFYQANLMLERLEIPVAASEALDLVFDVHGSPRQIDPSAEVRQRVEGLLNRAGTIEADDVRKQAILQFRILDEYHSLVLIQARRSFAVAALATIVGVLFFLAAIAVGVMTKSVAIAVIPALAAAIVEVIAGLSLVLYRKATERLDVHSARLGDLQRLLVANSLVEAMTGSMRERARLELVLVVSGHNDPRNAGSRRQTSHTKTRSRDTRGQETRRNEVTELTDLELDPDAQQTYD
jgi:hypothetical protein